MKDIFDIFRIQNIEDNETWYTVKDAEQNRKIYKI